MKRLLEQPATDRLTARAQDLLQVVGATVPSDERARRVRRALDAAPSRAFARWVPRLAFAGTLVAAGAGAAGLGAFSVQLGGSAGPAGPPTARSATPPVSPPARRPSNTAPPPAVSAEPVLESPTPAPAPRNTARPASARASTDVARVHEAARALSQDGDAARALALLEREPVAPGSPLAEEALALRIRACVALRNGRQGKLAKSYLSLYPQGRYRELAARALSEGR